MLWSYLLRDLTYRVGPDVRLTLLETIDPQAASQPAGTPASRPARMIRFSGLLRTQNRRPEDVVGELMQSLERSPVLGQVHLEGCQAVTTSVSSFVMTAEIAE